MDFTKPEGTRCGRFASVMRSIKIVSCIVTGWLLFTSASFGQNAFAMEFNQPNNRFGTINLLDGTFTQLGTQGGILFNDIAQRADGTLFGIRNTQRLVTLDINTGAILTSRNFNVAGIQSLAISSGGTIYGATQSALYTINPNNARATLVGNFNNVQLNGNGQNIRFGSDGFLYVTDAGGSATDTTLFRVSTVNGAATTMAILANMPDLVLANAGSMLYGVGVQLGSPSPLTQDLVGIDLTSFTYNLLTPNFPNNFNFTTSQTFVVPIPEPSALALSFAGGMILFVINRNRNR